MRDQRGFALLEGVIGAALMGIGVLVLLVALTTHSIATRSIDANGQALHLVRTQLEDIQAAGYASSYPVTVTMPSADYNLTVSTVEQATKLQLVTVTLTRSSKTHLSVQMYKADLD